MALRNVDARTANVVSSYIVVAFEDDGGISQTFEAGGFIATSRYSIGDSCIAKCDCGFVLNLYRSIVIFNTTRKYIAIMKNDSMGNFRQIDNIFFAIAAMPCISLVFIFLDLCFAGACEWYFIMTDLPFQHLAVEVEHVIFLVVMGFDEDFAFSILLVGELRVFFIAFYKYLEVLAIFQRDQFAPASSVRVELVEDG